MKSRYIHEAQGTNVVDIRQAREARAVRTRNGGSGPPEGRGGCWLASLEEGTRFLAKEKAAYGSEVGDFVVASDPTDVVVLLAKSIKGRDGVFEWHEPIEFCRNFTLLRTMEIINGHDQSIQQGPVERDAHAEEQPPLHDGK